MPFTSINNREIFKNFALSLNILVSNTFNVVLSQIKYVGGTVKKIYYCKVKMTGYYFLH